MEKSRQVLHDIVGNIEKVIVGKTEAVKLMVISLACDSHILIEDVPGVGKTTLVSALAKSMNASFNRIQFTPDVMPSDITGFSMYNQKNNAFEFHKGAVMGNILLADEINRTPPKTQSSLLEAMEEKQVTVDGKTYELPKPFMVLATQNPIEYLGTYPLPEAQIDRFIMKISIGYPTGSEEKRIMQIYEHESPLDTLEPVASCEDIIYLQKKVRDIYCSSFVMDYIIDLVAKTRESNEVVLGASPRGSLYVLLAAKALALYDGREFVLPDDVKEVFLPVISHRMILRNETKFNKITSEHILQEILKQVDVPTGDYYEKNKIYFILLLVIGILTYYIEGYILTTLFYVSLLIPLLSYAAIWLTYKRFQVSHQVDKLKIIKGDKVNYTITLYNSNSLVYCPIKLKLEADKLLFKDQFESPTIILYPRTEESIVIPLQCKYRGYYKIGVKSIIIEDYFGLFSKEFKSIDTIRMIVYPKIKDLTFLPTSNVAVDEMTNLSEKTREEQNNIAHIREYEKGDTLNKVHWKLSAKYNALMVKQYSGEISNSINIILDSNKHYFDDELNIAVEDKMIETVVMIINYLLMHNKPMTFIYKDIKNVTIEGKGANDFQLFYEECAILEFTRKFDFGKAVLDYFYNENREVAINSNQYIITSNITDEFIYSLEQLSIQKSKITIVYIYVDNHYKNHKRLEKLNSEGYSLIEIPYDSDLDTLVEGI